MKQPSFNNPNPLIAIFLCAISFLKTEAQSTSYTALYTNSNFTKTVELTYAVGSVAASADASSGSAAYSIPIAVPPGTNGVTPNISVAYNSLSGGGIAGRGWSISGLSMITRVGQTIYHNSATKPVDFSSDDRFALDGMRLMSKTGTYGSDGATYGTETENFSTTTSNGDLGGGPLWFSVVTKDGVTMEFGNTSDARFLNNDNTKVLFWRINKILYTDGNYIEFKYLNTDRDSRIDEINYTGNAAANLTPYNKLKFAYSVRSDVNTTYVANASMVSKYILDNIIISAEGNEYFKAYNFYYTTNNNVNSFLKQVLETGSNGNFLNTTIFKYGDLPTNNFTTGTSTAFLNQTVNILAGDFNADGYSDILACTKNVVNNIVYHTNFKVYRKEPSSGNSTFTLSGTQNLPTNYKVINKTDVSNLYNFLTVDLSGDGADDIITVRTSTTGNDRRLDWIDWYESQNNATSFQYHNVIPQGISNNIIPTSGNYIFTGDFNGDGKSDLLTLLRSVNNSTQYKATKNDAIGVVFYEISISGSSTLSINDWGIAEKIHVLDFNGDGKSDLMVIKNTVCEIFTFEGNSAKSIFSGGFPTKYHLLYFGDFNGDGKTDILTRASTTNAQAPWYKDISTGTGFIETPFTFNHTPLIYEGFQGDKLFISDFNGDGKMDISHSWNDLSILPAKTSRIHNYYSRGDAFHFEEYVYNSQVKRIKIHSRRESMFIAQSKGIFLKSRRDFMFSGASFYIKSLRDFSCISI